MTTVIFVHGTGVRAADYERTFKLIARQLEQYSKRTDLHLARCLWGEQFGSQLHLRGASIPLYDRTRSLEEVERVEVTDIDVERMLWSLLYQDPLYELRLLAIKARVATDTAFPAAIDFNIISPGDVLDESVQGLTVSAELEEKLEEMGIAMVFSEAHKAVVTSAAYQDALQTAQEDGAGECGIAIARALVAQAIVLCEQQQQSSPSL